MSITIPRGMVVGVECAPVSLMFPSGGVHKGEYSHPENCGHTLVDEARPLKKEKSLGQLFVALMLIVVG